MQYLHLLYTFRSLPQQHIVANTDVLRVQLWALLGAQLRTRTTCTP